MNQNIDVHRIFAEYFQGYEALAYAVSAKLGQGNICLDIDEYLNTENIHEINPFFDTEDGFTELTKEGSYVTHDDIELKPFIIKNGKAYLHRYFQYETQIIKNIERFGNNFKIITGGPGTGKTYGVSTELSRLFLESPELNVALAAPTGKAAARMNEAIKHFAEDPENSISNAVRTKLTGLNAQTIHRLLGYIRDSVFFNYNMERRLPFDVVIIDECSMIDGALMAKLLNAIDDNTSLYLLGDKDQLASVEAGSVFGDMCRLKESSLLKGRIEIKDKSWRFDRDKGIGKFSREVIDGTFKEIDSFKDDEQINIDTNFNENLFKEMALKYIDYIQETDIKKALEKLNNIRFLCVTREHDHSVAETNIKIEKILKYKFNDNSKFNPEEGFYHNQPVIITRNDYNLKIFNGDVGLIRRKDNILVAYFENTDGEIRNIPAGYLNHYDTVFAMTIHKSQGSEFDHEVLLLPEKQGEKLLTRELLYTGVTRAKKSVLIQSTEEVLLKCVEKEVSRTSGLQQRLKSE